MITVGVRVLKSQLSQYLQYVKDGERVIVTEHNKVIAEIRKIQEKKNVSAIEKKLIRLAKTGDIIPAKRKRSFTKPPAIEEKLDWESVYNETRADRI